MINQHKQNQNNHSQTPSSSSVPSNRRSLRIASEDDPQSSQRTSQDKCNC